MRVATENGWNGAIHASCRDQRLVELLSFTFLDSPQPGILSATLQGTFYSTSAVVSVVYSSANQGPRS